MAFGTLTIQTEDGTHDEFEIVKPSTTVGRQTTNDIVLQTTSASRYHARVDVRDGQVCLIDLESSHGTFINDEPVPTEVPVVLSHGDEVSIGEVRLVFSAPSQRGPTSLLPGTSTIEADGVPFRLVLDKPHQSVAPGARLQLSLIIENLTDDEETYTITVGGMDHDWARTNRREALLDPHEKTEVMVTIKPPRNINTRPGLYALTVRVALTDNPTTYLEVVREIDVVGYSGFGMVIRPGSPTGRYQLGLQNYGNVPLAVSFSGYDRGGLLAYDFKPSEVHIEPGEAAGVTATVSSSRDKVDTTFVVLAHSLGVSAFQAPVTGRYQSGVRPGGSRHVLMFAGIGLPLIGGIGVVLALIIALVLYVTWNNGQVGPVNVSGLFGAVTETPIPSPTATALPPTPTLAPTPAASIMAFDVTPSEFLYGTEGQVVISWEANNYGDLTLYHNDVAVPLSAQQISIGLYGIPFQDLNSGEHRFKLTIEGADGKPRSESGVVTSMLVLCTVDYQGGERVLYREPNPDASTRPAFSSPVVIPAGRTEDANWVFLESASFDATGWIPAIQLTCPDDAPGINEYRVIEPTPAP